MEIDWMERRCCVCGQDDYTFMFQPPRSPGPIVQCKNCGFVYVNPVETTQSLIQVGPVLKDRPEYLRTSSDLNEIKGSWEEPIIEGYMKELPAKRKNAREALGHIDAIAPKRGKILDVGCFCGVFLSVAAEDGWDAYGMEPLVMPSIYARGTFGLKVTNDTLREDSFAPETFDAATAFQVFEHIIDPTTEILKIRKFLKPGGLLMIEVPNIDTLLVNLMKTKHRHFVEDHVSFFSAKTLGRLLEQHGFKVKKVYYPVRTLSLDHLAWWSRRFVGENLGGKIHDRVKQSRLKSKTLNVSLGDIVSVIAQKV
jgi:2-polyprenyl-3-methyl-5-hydroxy-6-metoxy-1,4-benzoquinol methylase